VHRRTRLAWASGIALALAIVGLAAGALMASAARSDVVGHVYVNDNTADTNTVAGFARHADGTLTALPGSPFAVGGAGTGMAIGTQGALQLSSDGRYLLAVDAKSNQISVLRLLPNGALLPAGGSPVSSDGVGPISIAVHGSLVYVANTGNGGSNYTGFTLNAGGHLTPLDDSTVKLPDGSGPGDVLFNAAGTRLVGVRVNTSLIDSSVVGGDGRLTAAPGSPFAAQAAGPFGSAFRPTNPAQLFVSNAHAGMNAGSVSAYDDANDGTLTPIGASPYADNQTAPCWVDITPDGQYLFAVNTASASVSRYAIKDDGTLSLLGSTPLSGGTALKPFDLRVAPDGKFAYVVDPGIDAVSALAVDGGSLTELSSSPFALPAGAAPFGIVVD
jgi:6-phosphogluconolactonase